MLQGNYQNGAAYTFILLITFWILYSYLVPISLFVTMEIVKFWQVGRLGAALRAHMLMRQLCVQPGTLWSCMGWQSSGAALQCARMRPGQPRGLIVQQGTRPTASAQGAGALKPPPARRASSTSTWTTRCRTRPRRSTRARATPT